MIKKISRAIIRENKHRKLRKRYFGTESCPRLCVYRSNKHMYAQLIDDTKGITLCSANTLQKDVYDGLDKTNNTEAASKVGQVIAKKAIDLGISDVVFDRGGLIYQGKISALADSAREAGLNF